MHELVRKLIGGAVHGVLATVPMTVTMFGARGLGLMRELPPKTITDAALDGAEVDTPESGASALAGVAHLAYGAGCGALYAAVVPPCRVSTGAVLGMTFGTAVWFASYQGWVPAVGIMPPASRDRPGRPATMFIAHLVFGATLGALLAHRARRRQNESAAQGATQTWHRERHHRDHRCRGADAVHA